MHRVVQYMHDICAVHIRQNYVHGHPKLLVVRWLGPSIAVRVRIRNREWILHFFSLSITTIQVERKR